MDNIHETAIVKTSDISPTAKIGPFCYIGENVIIDDHVNIFGFSVIGGEAQWRDKPKPNQGRKIIIRNWTSIREFVTINLPVHEETFIGENVEIYAKAHIGHDAVIEDGVIVGSSAHVSGFCRVGTHSVLGSNSVIHQRYCLPAYSMLGSNSMFKSKCNTEGLIWVGSIAFPVKINKVGLERHVRDKEIIKTMEKAAKSVLFNFSSLKKTFKNSS